MSKLTADKCREQFENWLTDGASELHKMLLTDRYDSGSYRLAKSENQWQAWQASRESLEIALPILEQQERGEGEWIDWNGGEPPIKPGDIVDIKCRDGEFFRRLEDYELDWKYDGTPSDIIAYRIIPERATNQNGEQ